MEVSYGAAALLMATGAGTSLGNKNPSYRMVAAIPFLFGVQQVSEGIVWQTLGAQSASTLHQFGVSLFLSFAIVVWPAWIPWSFYHIEPNQRRKRILKYIGFLGLIVSLLAAWVIFKANLKAYVVGHSLGYSFLNMDRLWPPNLEALLYFTPTVIPFFVSSLRMIKKAGYLIFISMLLAKAINEEAQTSVWCFFAALISLYIALNVLWLQKGNKKPAL